MLYLIPTHLGNDDSKLLAIQIKTTIEQCDIIFAENLKTTRHFFKALQVSKKIDDFTWHQLTKDTTLAQLQAHKANLLHKKVAIVSEAGLPAIADPGHLLVQVAHTCHCRVVPLSGPSSIFMALMASGFNGQNFAFIGYLPIDKIERIKAIKNIEQLAKKQTQIFIETPYRNNNLVADIVAHCNANTQLTIASDITLQTEFIATKTIQQWKSTTIDLNKRPTVFLIGNY